MGRWPRGPSLARHPTLAHPPSPPLPHRRAHVLRDVGVDLVALVVDRGGRELPIQPAFAAAKIVLPATQKLSLARADGGRVTFSVQGQA